MHDFYRVLKFPAIFLCEIFERKARFISKPCKNRADWSYFNIFVPLELLSRSSTIIKYIFNKFLFSELLLNVKLLNMYLMIVVKRDVKALIIFHPKHISTYRNSQKNESILLHRYVLNEYLTADRSCTTKHFWKNSKKKLVAHIFTLLLAPFAFKLVHYSRHNESLNNVWKR